jgi:hypothetical protein
MPASELPTPTPPAPASAPPCRAEDVTLRSTGYPPGDTEDDGTLVDVVSRPGRACELSGTPRATLTDSSGRVVALPTNPRMSPPPAPFANAGGRVFILRRRSATLWLYAPRSCERGGDATPRYVALAVTIGGQAVVARGFSIPGSCGVSISSYYQ